MKKYRYRRATAISMYIYRCRNDTWSIPGRTSEQYRRWSSPATPRGSFNVREISTNYISKSEIYEKHDIVLIKTTLCWADITVDIKRYKYDAIPLKTRYEPSISDICIGKSEMKMYRFDIDNVICQVDIAADMETTKIQWNLVAETTSFDVE